MELNELTREQLASENPALVNEIIQQAVADERERVNGIDALMMPGWEVDAARAKADGTSVEDFLKAMVAKARQKGADFLAQRQQETAKAQEVGAGSADDEPDEMARFVAQAKKDADEMTGHGNGMF